VNDAAALLGELDRRGLLLLQDALLPDAIGALTGAKAAGSWWSHPDAHRLFAVFEQTTDHPDVLVVKLVAGKLTFVHRRLWPALLGVASAREAWQTAGVSAKALELLAALERQPSIEVTGAAAKEIETRLLAHSERVHTERGHHVTRLEPWSRWAERSRCPAALPAETARHTLEAALRELGGKAELLPWHARRARQPMRRPR
jgi:hypothetical protein